MDVIPVFRHKPIRVEGKWIRIVVGVVMYGIDRDFDGHSLLDLHSSVAQSYVFHGFPLKSKYWRIIAMSFGQKCVNEW